MTSPIKILSSMATKAVLAELAAQYARDTAIAVAVEAAGGVDVAKRVKAGEAVDVVVLSADAIDSLIAEGHVRPGSRVDLAKSGIFVAVREGEAAPDIGSEAGLKRAVEAARSVGYSSGPSGVYLEKLFARWGIADALTGRVVQAPPGVPVGSLVAEGEVALGFQQLSELLHLKGIRIIGPLPPPVQLVTTFSGGVSATCTRGEAARAALSYMVSPAADAAKKRSGMECA